MIFNSFGNSNNPVVIMLAGSFCPAESMEIIYKELEKDYYVIAPPPIMAVMKIVRHLLLDRVKLQKFVHILRKEKSQQ